jgi:hypothetical protein
MNCRKSRSISVYCTFTPSSNSSDDEKESNDGEPLHQPSSSIEDDATKRTF